MRRLPKVWRENSREQHTPNSERQETTAEKEREHLETKDKEKKHQQKDTKTTSITTKNRNPSRPLRGRKSFLLLNQV